MLFKGVAVALHDLEHDRESSGGTKPGAGREWGGAGKEQQRREWESMGSGEQVTEAHSVTEGAPSRDMVTSSEHLACIC